MLTTCTKCGACYEAGSEEQANEPDRMCRWCIAHNADCTCTRSIPGMSGPHHDKCPAKAREGGQ